MIDHEVYNLQSKYLTSQAENLRVKVLGLNWLRSPLTGKAYLSDESYYALRAAIRAEKKARWELHLMWIPAITSIVGALTGFTGVIVAYLALNVAK